MRTLDFYYDVVCPYAYLAHTAVRPLAERAGATLRFRPILLGGLYRAIGANDNPNATMAPPKAVMNARDMARAADVRKVPLFMPAAHPRRTVLAMRAIVASGEAHVEQATRALYAAYWAEGLDVTDPGVVAGVLERAGLDGAAIVARAESQAVKDDLRARTDEAAAAGAFGVPTFVVTSDGAAPELYFGQDRMHFVAEALGVDAAPVLPGGDSSVPLEFFFDFGSPYAYLASTAVEAVAARHATHVVYRPFLLGGLFKSIGTADVPLFTMPAVKQAWIGRDIERWARHRGVAYRFPTRFPMSTVTALRLTLGVPNAERGALVAALFRAYWAEDRDLADAATLASIASEALGRDGAALVAATQAPDAKAALRAATDEAVAAGVCGAPCLRVGPMLFWGQDRLDLAERALAGWRPACG